MVGNSSASHGTLGMDAAGALMTLIHSSMAPGLFDYRSGGQFSCNGRNNKLARKADEVIGDLWAEQKAGALVAAGAWGYVGDHTKDMVAATTAGVRAIGVTSGACSAQELWQAGADNVLQILEEFSSILMPPPTP